MYKHKRANTELLLVKFDTFLVFTLVIVRGRARHCKHSGISWGMIQCIKRELYEITFQTILFKRVSLKNMIVAHPVEPSSYVVSNSSPTVFITITITQHLGYFFGIFFYWSVTAKERGEKDGWNRKKTKAGIDFSLVTWETCSGWATGTPNNITNFND